jgi:hypothetical protein
VAAYLTANPPARQQWYATRNRSLTGATVLHGTESVFDEMGVDTGAENVARFIQQRSTPGSYHDLVDSDSRVHLVEYVHAAFHDGTGSNNWALALAFACRTVDWARMAPVKRAGMLAHGARAFAEQQKYRKRIGAPLTRLRYITKAQSDSGSSGFCCHGWRDPARRSDPGTEAPHLFPFDEWLAACRAALAEHMPDHPDAPQEGFMAALSDSEQRELLDASRVLMKELRRVTHGVGSPTPTTAAIGDIFVHARVAAAMATAAAQAADVDEAALARALAPAVIEALGRSHGITAADVEAAVRRVFASVA